MATSQANAMLAESMIMRRMINPAGVIRPRRRSKADQRLQQPAEQPVKSHSAVKRGKADAIRSRIDDGLVIDVGVGFVEIARAVATAPVGK
jgi:hypothetical protein